MKFDWKKLHVKDADVEFGRRVDALRAKLDAEYKQAVQAPMRAARKAEDERAMLDSQRMSPRMGRGELTDNAATLRLLEKNLAMAPIAAANVASMAMPGRAGLATGMGLAATLEGDPTTGAAAGAVAGGRRGVLGALSAALGAGSAEAQAGLFNKLPAALRRAFENLELSSATPEQAAALKAYTHSKEPFKPPNKNSRAAIEYAVSRGELTPEQAANMPATRQALLDLLNQPLALPGPVYRGVGLPAVPRMMDAVGGAGGPASFSYDPMMAGLFTIPQENKKRILMEGFPEGKTRGVVVPKWILNSNDHEAEVLLHPDTNLVVTGRKIEPDEEDGPLHLLEGFLDHGLPPDVRAWKDGGRIKKAGGGIVKKFLKSMPEYFEGAANRPAPQGALSVIKERGGNWLNGSIDEELGQLRKPALSPEDTALAQSRIDEALSKGIVTPEYVEGAQRRMKEYRANSAINDWLFRNLKNYIRNDMATPGDPVRALAERGVLHFEPYNRLDSANINRLYADRLVRTPGLTSPGTRLGVSPTGRAWEDAADSVVRTRPSEFLAKMETIGGSNPGPTYLRDNPWLDSVPPGTPVHNLFPTTSATSTFDNVGFSHLIDELSNAINPASGLPQHLQFPADRLSKVSVPQAVERVAQINAWRAAQKAEADAAIANNAATVLHKDYPDKGMRWVELRQPDALPGGFSKDVHGNIIGPDGNYTANPGEKHLESALKYEGDTMGHCVGGYCDDVVSGRSRIYSLRDAKGQPHVTIEVSPGTSPDLEDEEIGLSAFLREHPYMANASYEDKVRMWADWSGMSADDVLGNTGLPHIVQIKGKQNSKPNDEYLPFVQDFVRSGKWSDVGDIQNTGLTLHPSGKYITDAEANALAERHFGKVKMGNKPDDIENAWQYAARLGRYDNDMLSEADKAFLADWKAGNFTNP